MIVGKIGAFLKYACTVFCSYKNEFRIKSVIILPSSVLLMTIFSLSSRFHRIVGVGLPEALQVRVTFAFSRTIASEELWESSILGGTGKYEIYSTFGEIYT